MSINQPQSETGLIKAMCVEPLPLIPAGLKPEIDKYLRDLTMYLTRISTRAVAEVVAQTLPEVPDRSKDYVFCWDATTGAYKWVETSEEC